MTVGELVVAGGPEALARRAAAEAAEKAAALERQFWLRVLERWQRNNEPDDLSISLQVSTSASCAESLASSRRRN